MKIRGVVFPRRLSPKAQRLACILAGVWLAWSIAVTFCYYRTNITLFRAESGWFHGMARAMPAPHFAAFRHFLTHSHGGHYTPFAYYAEVELSYLLGPREAPWRWRQLTVVVFLGACLSCLAFRIAKLQRVPPVRAAAAAAGLSSLFVFQPFMHELVASPLLALQITAGSFFALTLFVLLQWIQNPGRKGWIWLAAALAYLSMHLVGYGLATVAATAAVFMIVLLGIYFGRLPSFVPVRRTLVVCLIVMLLLAGVHVFLMVFLRHPSGPDASGAPVDMKSVLVFVAALFFGATHDLFAFDPPASFHGQLPPSLWPWGLLLLIFATSSLIWLARACAHRPRTVRLVHFVVHCFSAAAFFVLILMCAARRIFEPSPTGFHDYLLGARYIVPANLLLFGSFATLAAAIARRAGRATCLIFVLLALMALLASREFGAGQFKQIYSVGAISHGKAWRTMVALAEQCRAANLPVPNVPMGGLTCEFRDFDLKLFEPLLRYSLHLPPDARIEFEPWAKVVGEERTKYEAATPALRQIIGLLRLQVPPGS